LKPNNSVLLKTTFFWKTAATQSTGAKNLVGVEPKDIKDLLEAGFEYVCEKDGQAFLKKRK